MTATLETDVALRDAINAGDVPDEFEIRRIVFRNLRLRDLLQPLDVARRAADPGHAGALVAKQEFCVGPALVLLAD